MTEKVDVWMPLYIGDYLSSTSRLTTEQHGGYLLLIMDYWKNGPLPDDDAVLAQICRMSSDAWSNARSTLRAFFEQESGMLIHRRVDAELADAKEGKAKRKTKAVAAAAKRWGKDAPSNAPSNNQALLDDCPSPSPSPISIPDGIDSAKNNSSPVDKVVSPAAQPKAKPPTKGSRLSAEWVLPKGWGEWALKERLDLSSDDVRREADNFRDHWLSTAGEKGVKADWLATWRKWIRSDYVKPSGKAGNMAKSGHWFMSSTGIEAKGAELGIAQAPGEVFPNFRNRIYRAAGVTDEMVRKAKIDAGERV